MSNLTDNFEKLPPFHKKIFALLLMYGLPVSMTAFLRVVSFAELNDPNTGKPLISSQLGGIFRQMQQSGLIRGQTGQPWQVEERTQDLLNHPLLRENYNHWLPGIQEQHEIALNTNTNRPWAYEKMPDGYEIALVLQPFRLILHHPEWTLQKKKLAFQKKLQIIEKNGQLAQTFWVNVLNICEDPLEIWPLLTEEQEVRIFESIKNCVLDFELPAELLTKFARDGMPELCRFSLAELYLLMGNIGKAGDILQDTSPEYMKFGWVNSIIGLYKYLAGDRAGALELFEIALQQYKKQTRKRKNYFPYLAGLFYVLAMMQEDMDKYRARINEFLIVGKKEKSYDMQHYWLLDLLFKIQDEEQDQFSHADWAPRDSWLSGSILDIIVYVILLSWSSNTTQLKISNNWSKTKANLQKHGFDGMLANLLMLQDNKPAAIFSQPRPVGEDWQRALKRLEDFTNSKTAGVTAKKANAARIAWLVTCQGGYAEVQPKLQKLTNQGGWTKGRNIALKKLANGSFTEAELTAADMKAISCIEVCFDYNGWGTETSYEVNAQKAISMLAGHPAAIARDGRPVEISTSSPDLVIKKNRDESYSLAFSKTIPPETGQ